MLESIENGVLTYNKLTKQEMEDRGILGRLIGVVADFISPTRNGRKYPEKLWENVFNDPIMKERIDNGVCYGELGHPADREETDMEKIAVCMAEQPKKGSDGKLRAVFDILDTPNGRILKSLCDYGSTLGISSRGSGDLETDFDGQESVNPDTYNCEGFDVVLIPAVKEARLQYVTEALDKKRYNKTLRQKLTESINKETKEHRKIISESLDVLGLPLVEDVTVVTRNMTTRHGKQVEEVEKYNYKTMEEAEAAAQKFLDTSDEVSINGTLVQKKPVLKKFKVRYVNSSDLSCEKIVSAESKEDAENIVKQQLKDDCYHVHQVDELDESLFDYKDTSFDDYTASLDKNKTPEMKDLISEIKSEVKKITDFYIVDIDYIISSNKHNLAITCISQTDEPLTKDELNKLADEIIDVLITRFDAKGIDCWQKISYENYWGSYNNEIEVFLWVDGMKIGAIHEGITLEEAKLSPQDKMDMWHAGERRENISACGDSKLLQYKEICEHKGYDEEVDIINRELQKRGLLSDSTAESSTHDDQDAKLTAKMESGELLILANKAGVAFLQQYRSEPYDTEQLMKGWERYFVIRKTDKDANRIAQGILSTLNESLLNKELTEEFIAKLNDNINEQRTISDAINSDSSIAAEDDRAMVEELQKSLDINQKLDKKIVDLQEKLSVSYAK